jgi:PDZ domain-containing protein
MSRRTLSLAVAAVLLVVLTIVAALRPVPYVAMRPGPVQDTLGALGGQDIVEISGRRVYPTSGQLDLTTVSVTSPGARLSLAEALYAWVDPERVVLPRDAVYPPQQSVRDAEEQSSVEMVVSQDAAVVAALTALRIEVDYDVRVGDVAADSPARGYLESRDLILAVEGQPVQDATDVGELLQEVPAGDAARLEIRRDGERRMVSTPTTAAPDDPARTIVGITVANDPDFPFDVSIELGDRIGGPSAGLMFALAIVDKLSPGALTGGLHVAGTGEIDAEGRVGAIGGIQQKVAGAAEAGASVFLVPARNCREATSAESADQLRLVRVRRLSQAVDALEDLAAGDERAVPTCRS